MFRLLLILALAVASAVCTSTSRLAAQILPIPTLDGLPTEVATDDAADSDENDDVGDDESNAEDTHDAADESPLDASEAEADDDRNTIDGDTTDRRAKETERNGQRSGRDARRAEEAEVVRQFDELAKQLLDELEVRKKASEGGIDVLQRCRDEYRDEYKRLAQTLQELKPDATDHQTQRAKLERRKRILAIHLWAIGSLEPIVQLRPVAVNDLQRKLYEFVNSNPRFTNVLGNRVGEVQQKLSTAQEGRGFAFANGNMQRAQMFHDITNELDHELLGIETEVDTAARHHNVLESMRTPLQLILKLNWTGNRLELDRSRWGELFGNVSVLESRKAILERLQQNHIVIEDDSVFHPMMQMMQDDPRFVVLLMQNLSFAASQEDEGNYNSNESGSENFNFEASSLRVRLENTEDTFSFQMYEKLPPRRNVDIFYKTDGTLRLTVTGDQIMALLQQPNGSVQVLQTYGDQLLHASGPSFLELYTQKTDFIDTGILATLDRIGITPPPTRFSSLIVAQVVRQLRLQAADEPGKFARLLTELDDVDFEKREAASRELESNAEIYLDRMRTAFADPQVSLEARSRLQRALELYEQRWQFSDDLVRRLKLLEDVPYLVNLLAKLSPADVEPVTERLHVLTNQNFGRDTDAWRQWLVDRSAAQPKP